MKTELDKVELQELLFGLELSIAGSAEVGDHDGIVAYKARLLQKMERWRDTVLVNGAKLEHEQRSRRIKDKWLQKNHPVVYAEQLMALEEGMDKHAAQVMKRMYNQLRDYGIDTPED